MITVNAATISGISLWIEYNPVIDVSALVKDMFAFGQSNYVFMLKCKVEQPCRTMTFYSFGNPRIQLRLKLDFDKLDDNDKYYCTKDKYSKYK
ncbi:unnamed protein product [Adineta ricciae]|uniref:Uncharacterized protein n=1 Tax=Adineta ricciae TaxID=249248 RepID=A0A815MUR1_ADIRI|nr:unnamed protein product [Adineta ricciae]CAF1442795.1 unnamed protein product [Adineta ricciae]